MEPRVARIEARADEDIGTDRWHIVEAGHNVRQARAAHDVHDDLAEDITKELRIPLHMRRRPADLGPYLRLAEGCEHAQRRRARVVERQRGGVGVGGGEQLSLEDLCMCIGVGVWARGRACAWGRGKQGQVHAQSTHGG